MYARNNASPRPITIGAVVQISDGAVQTTGVSVKVRKDTGAWGAGAGTLAVEEGIWSYTPTQGETDCDALQVIIYKTSCIPNSMEVVFTDAAEFGQVVLAGVTHTNAVIPTVSSVTNRVTANTDQWDGVAVTGMPMPTYTQPTGFLTAAFPTTVASPTNITSATGIVLAATTHTGALIPWNPDWDAEVQSEVQDAIEANHLDHLLAVTYDPASKPGVADALLNELVQDNGSGVSQFTSIALALASGGGGGTDWTTDERTAIRSILGIPTSGTTPTDPASGILDTIRDLVIVVDSVADAVEADTQNIQGRLPAALVAGRMASNAEVVGDKTGYSLSTVGVNTIADAVLEESVDDHDGVANSLAKYISIIKKGNTVVDGTVTSATTPTTTSFSSNVNYPTGAFKHAVMLFLDGNLSEQNSPILTYTNANGVITVEEAFTQAPQVGDNFIIIPTTHVHAISAISSAVWSDAAADDAIRAAVGLAAASLDSQLAAALVLQKLAASGATGSVQVTDNGNGTATLVFKDTNGSTTLATVTYNYTSGARTRVS
jgi:hypothetical protein